MSEYTSQFRLRYDPFDNEAEPADYFPGGNRQQLLDQLIQLSCYSSDIAVINGPLGSGKSTLSHTLAQSLDDDFIIVCLQASLFMDKTQLLVAICNGLNLDMVDLATFDDYRTAIVNFAGFMADKSKTVQVIIDDAHELSSDTIQELALLVESQADTAVLGEGGIKVVLLGESQLPETLAQVTNVSVSHFALDPLTLEETADYISFKLASAGYTGDLPLGEVTVAIIQEKAGGTPGAINYLVRDELGHAEVVPQMASFSPLIFTERHLVAASAVFALVLIGLFVFFGGGEDVPENVVAEVQQDRVDIPIDVSSAARQETPITEFEPDTGLITTEPAQLAAGAINQDPVATEPTGEPIEIAENTNNEPEPVTELAGAGEADPSDPADNESNPQPEIASDNFEIATQEVEEVIAPIEAAPGHPLLAYPADSYTLQVLGSRSETNVQNFIDSNSNDDSYNYFETRFEDQPWFVVVYGSFPDPLSARAAISDLPPSVGELKPWARHLSDIQQDIRTYSQ